MPSVNRGMKNPSGRELSRQYDVSWQLGLSLQRAMPRHFLHRARLNLARSTIDLALEHHLAIARLVRHGECGSAFALVRPLFEAGVCAYWVLYSVPSDLLLEWIKGERDRPDLDKMITALKRTGLFPAMSKLQAMMQGGGRVFHQLTHGDLAQLERRTHTTKFLAGEVSGMLWIADAFVIAACAGAMKLYQSQGFDRLIATEMGRIALESVPPGDTPDPVSELPEPLGKDPWD